VASATLQWSASSDPTVTGYRVYYGTTSKTYQAKGSGLDASSAMNYVVPNLTVGKTYYFAVTAYDAAGNESDFSAEATKTAQ
jgi:fibronectin type 3 domain-containing protein